MQVVGTFGPCMVARVGQMKYRETAQNEAEPKEEKIRS
jgi:hypothetical protein